MVVGTFFHWNSIKVKIQGQEISLSEVLGYMFAVCLVYLVQIFTNCHPNVNVSLCSGFSLLHLNTIVCFSGPPSETSVPGTYVK